MHSATGRRSEAKGGDGSGRRVSEEGSQVEGGADAEPSGRGSSRCQPGPGAPELQTPDPGLEGDLGGLQPVPAAQPSIRTSHTIRLLPPRGTAAPAALAVEALPRGKA